MPCARVGRFLCKFGGSVACSGQFARAHVPFSNVLSRSRWLQRACWFSRARRFSRCAFIAARARGFSRCDARQRTKLRGIESLRPSARVVACDGALLCAGAAAPDRYRFSALVLAACASHCGLLTASGPSRRPREARANPRRASAGAGKRQRISRPLARGRFF